MRRRRQDADPSVTMSPNTVSPNTVSANTVSPKTARPETSPGREKAQITGRAGKPRTKKRVMPMATRRERLESKEAAIIEAAYQHFHKKGFAKSKISEIARSASVAEGTVYLYFRHKKALAEAVLQRFYTVLTDEAAAGVKACETTREALLFLAQYHLDTAIRHRFILQMLSVVDKEGESAAGGAIYEMNKKYVAIFDALLHERSLCGDLPCSISTESCRKWMIRDMFYGSLNHAARSILIRDRGTGAVCAFATALVDRLICQMPSTGSEARPGGEPAQEKFREDSDRYLSRRLSRVVDRLEDAVEKLAHESAG